MKTNFVCDQPIVYPNGIMPFSRRNVLRGSTVLQLLYIQCLPVNTILKIFQHL